MDQPGKNERAIIFVYPQSELIFFLTVQKRLVTLSSFPFTIVHANGAFIRFSETDPSKIIGSPFSDIFYSEYWMDGKDKNHNRLKPKSATISDAFFLLFNTLC